MKEAEEVKVHKSKKGKTMEGGQPETSRARRRRHITQHDFRLGQQLEEYDLVRDIRMKKPDITYGQLLGLSSKLRRQWSGCVSIRRSSKSKTPNETVMTLKVGNKADMVLTLEVCYTDLCRRRSTSLCPD